MGSTPVVTTIPLGKSIQAVAVNPETNLVYAADANGNQLFVLDGANGYAVAAQLPVGNTPYSLAVDVAANQIWVLCQNMPSNFARRSADAPLSFIQVYDGATNQQIHQVDFSDDIPMWIALNPATRDAYAVGSNLTRIANFQIAKSIVLGGGYQVAADPVSGTVYATYLGPHFQLYVARFQGVSLDFIDQTVLFPNGDGVAVNTRRNVIYTTSIGPYNDVQVWDPTNSPMTNLANVPTGGYPQHVAVNEPFDRYYTNNYWDSTVSIVDAATNTAVGAAVPVGPSPYDIAVDPIRNVVFTANYVGSVSWFVDTAS